MITHVKLVCLSVGLLVALGGLSSVSSAVRRQEIKPQRASPAANAATLQTAQNRVMTGAAFRAAAFSY